MGAGDVIIGLEPQEAQLLKRLLGTHSQVIEKRLKAADKFNWDAASTRHLEIDKKLLRIIGRKLDGGVG